MIRLQEAPVKHTSRPRFLACARPPASARSAAEPAAIGYSPPTPNLHKKEDNNSQLHVSLQPDLLSCTSLYPLNDLQMNIHINTCGSRLIRLSGVASMRTTKGM